MQASAPSRSAQVRAILCLGVFSMIFAEVLSGSSPLWVASVWAWVVTFPIYLTHSVILLNIALRSGRTRWEHLYLFGALFGHYEGAITRVLWIGYPDSEAPLFGTVADLAIFEHVTLILFWHPLFAFLVPIAVVGLLIERFGTAPRLDLPGSPRTRRGRWAWVGMAMMGGCFLSHSLQYQMGPIVAAVGLSGLVAGLSVWLARPALGAFGLDALTLSRRALIAWIVATLALIYVPLWFFYDRIAPRPSLIGAIAYVLSIGGFVLLLRLCRPVATAPLAGDPGPVPSISITDGVVFGGLVLGSAIGFAIVPAVSTVVATIAFLLLPVFGLILLAWVLWRLARAPRLPLEA